MRLRYAATVFEVEVADDGRGDHDDRDRPVGGHGLIGMRERVSLHGGHLRAGPGEGGGFVVRATFPSEGARP